LSDCDPKKKKKMASNGHNTSKKGGRNTGEVLYGLQSHLFHKSRWTNHREEVGENPNELNKPRNEWCLFDANGWYCDTN
jgi:hypothetical protein